VATQGRNIGGLRFTSAFLTGGIFGYDGVHPTELGYGIVANEWISVINANGGNLPPVDLEPLVFASQARAVRTASVRRPAFEFSQKAWDALLTAFPPVGRR
jgi:hypothetical protein